ncbi:MAG: phytanoyl-CoA dioxygenase family protein [Planctomycetota bacterium]|jgi:phytanoyl-CoA hydroxylase
MTTPSIADRVRQEFSDNGFVAFRAFVSGDDLAELVSHVERFIRDIVPTMPTDHVFYEDRSDRSTLKQLQLLGDNDPWFHDLFHVGAFRQIAEVLLGGPVVPKNLQYFCKPPGIGQATPAHQDGYYFMLDPCEAVTMWLSLDEVDDENGCVWYVPGSHREGMRDHSRTQTLGFSQGIVGYPTEDDRQREVALPAQPGDLLVHHAMTIHRAGRNRSGCRLRRALGFVYFSERAKVDIEARDAYQKKLAAEMRAARQI